MSKNTIHIYYVCTTPVLISWNTLKDSLHLTCTANQGNSGIKGGWKLSIFEKFSKTKKTNLKAQETSVLIILDKNSTWKFKNFQLNFCEKIGFSIKNCTQKGQNWMGKCSFTISVVPVW